MDPLALLRPEGCAQSLPAHPVRALGIDLGTTNSTVAEIVWQPSGTEPKIRCLEVDQETLSGTYTHILVPSAVAIHDGKMVVGEGAKRLLARAAEFGLERDKTLFLECKNDMGVRRTYHKAPGGFRCAAEIGSKVLSFLKEAAAAHDPTPAARTVVTVPASFQAAQRLDTVKAAELAGISISGGDLLDEPIAAFIDYLMLKPEDLAASLQAHRKLLVFDFGGGTCDVAVLQIGGSGSSGLQVSPLAVSRYHRLGGGDIDRAIVFEVLLPQILEQNKLKPHDLSFEDKKHFIEPAYLAVAEALKIGLCTEINRLASFGQYASADKNTISKKQPGLHECQINGRTLQLHSPSLTAAQFESLLAPFLERELLYARETEYRLTCSIFAPVQDALDRAGLTPDNLDFVLLVGGSSLIPQIAQAVAGFFPKTRFLSYPDRDSLQVAIARGAAWHSLGLALYGRGLFQVATPDRISIRTSSGAFELIPKGSPLPFPDGEDAWAKTYRLKVPKGSPLDPVKLLVEILAGEPDLPRSLGSMVCDLPAPVTAGDNLCLEYRLDENQVLDFRLTLAAADDDNAFTWRIENPLSNVVNPHATRLKIQQLEEDLRTGQIPAEQVPDTIVEVARSYAEIQQTDKAISYLRRALRMRNRPEPGILNLLGIYYGEQGNAEMEEQCYRECAQVAPDWGAPLFNLALAQKSRRKFTEAMRSIGQCLERRTDGSTLTLKAVVADAQGIAEARDKALADALREFSSPRSMSDWELGWYATAARMASNMSKLAEATDEQRRRAKLSGKSPAQDAVLPDLSPTRDNR